MNSLIKFRPLTRPFEHQIKATKRAVKRGNLAFFMDPGTGKTKAVLDAVAIQALRGRVKRVVVFCPLSAVDVWVLEQIPEHFGLNYNSFIAGTDPGEDERKVRDRGDPVVSFFIMNYDKLRQRERGRNLDWEYSWLEMVEEWNPDLVVLDESHRVKRAGAVTSQAIWRMVRRLRAARMGLKVSEYDDREDDATGQPFVYLMTGTPQGKGYIDLFAQYRVMDDRIFGTSKQEFEDGYCEYGYGKQRWTIIRYRDKHILLPKIKQNSFIVSKAKALDLPEQMWTKIPVRLPDKAKEAYREMAEEMVAELEDGTLIEAKNVGVRRMRLQQITGGFTTEGKQIHSATMEVAKDVLVDLHAAEKHLVAYARFLPEVRHLAVEADRVGYNTFVVSGATSAKDRRAAIETLQGTATSKRAPPVAIIFQVDTGSLAITLTAASEVLFYSLPDGWITYWQCLARVHRQGQKMPVTYRHLYCPGTVNVKHMSTLREKADFHAELMRSPREVLFGL